MIGVGAAVLILLGFLWVTTHPPVAGSTCVWKEVLVPRPGGGFIVEMERFCR